MVRLNNLHRIDWFQWMNRIGILALALFVASCSVGRSPVTGKKRAYAWSWEQEVQIGKEADASIIAQYGLYDDPELAAYVDRVAQQVLEESHMRRPDAREEFRNTEFTFRVLDSPIVNAFALPGGYIYVTRGLLAHMENEAQLAMVLGHEVGHVAARHSSQQALKTQFGQIGLIGGAILGEVMWGAGQQIMQVGGTAAQLLFLRYGRDNERESDKLGVEYAAMTGYKAEEGAAFFGTLKRLSEKAGANIPSFLSTHPDPGEREQRIIQMAGGWAEQGTAMTVVNRDALYEAIDGIVLGNNPRQGFVENNVFYHPDMKFQFPVPSGWKTQNGASQVALFDAEGEQVQAVIIFDLVADAESPADAASKLAGQEGITVRQNRGTRVNGYTAHMVQAQAQAEQTTYDLLAYFIAYEGNIFRFLGYTTTAKYRSYERLFSNTMQGFRTLTDNRVLTIQPDRLNIVNASNSGPFQTFVSGSLPRQFEAEDFAILNQTTLSANIAKGTALKLVN